MLTIKSSSESVNDPYAASVVMTDKVFIASEGEGGIFSIKRKDSTRVRNRHHAAKVLIASEGGIFSIKR